MEPFTVWYHTNTSLGLLLVTGPLQSLQMSKVAEEEDVFRPCSMSVGKWEGLALRKLQKIQCDTPVTFPLKLSGRLCHLPFWEHTWKSDLPCCIYGTWAHAVIVNSRSPGSSDTSWGNRKARGELPTQREWCWYISNSSHASKEVLKGIGPPSMRF